MTERQIIEFWHSILQGLMGIFWGFFMGGGSFANLNIFKYNILTFRLYNLVIHISTFRLYNLVIQYGTDTETGKAHE